MATLNLFHLALFLAVSSSLSQSHGLTNPRKLEEADSDDKCGGCPCSNPCNPSPPPPPSPKKSPPSNYCPPPPGPSGGGSGGGGSSQFPPSPPYAFINGPPQDLYPINSKSPESGRAPFWVAGLIVAVWW